MKIAVFWFRRDLRLEDNTALYHALNSGYPVLPVFIFDKNILANLPENDARVNFIYETVFSLNKKLKKYGSGLKTLLGNPVQAWEQILTEYDIEQVYLNKDYEPYARERDLQIKKLLVVRGIKLHEYKDQVIFEENEVCKDDGLPYTVFTPYKNKWLSLFDPQRVKTLPFTNLKNLYKLKNDFPALSQIGFRYSVIKVRSYDFSIIDEYAKTRNIPAIDGTSYLSPHLRFGTVSVRQVINQLHRGHEVFLSELIWREFFMQILFHFPHVVKQNFKTNYDGIVWRNNEKEFDRWCKGETGYAFVDAGMRQLNATGYMHNRVRMVTAGFLCKHLLIDWRWGEAYFAEKLLDYELSSNNGNWQWSAGTGCDAAPYFRIFNPDEQLKKFDKDLTYIKRWIPEYKKSTYIKPVIDHKYARQRAFDVYRLGLEK